MNLHWATTVVAILVTTYWARVMSMVWRRRRSHAGHFIPPERLGRLLRMIWIPLIWLWIALAWTAAFAPNAHPRCLLQRFDVNLLVAWCAVAGAAFALGFSIICWKKMGKSWRMGINPKDQTELILTGPYAYIRHPIYALSSLLMLCTMVVVANPAILVVGIAHIGLLQWEARREERYLLQRSACAYGHYRAHTGGFFPRSLRAYTSST